MKVKLIVFSDIQIEDWNRYSLNHSRLFHNEVILSKVLKLCIKYSCDALFCGDMFDNPHSLKNYLLNQVFKWFNKFKEAGVNIYCISGNHDQCEKNTLDYTSPNYINMLSDIYDNIINLDLNYIDYGSVRIHGIPYMSNDSSIIQAIKEASKKISKKQNILMLHTHLPGVKEPNGYEVESTLPKVVYKYLKKFTLVISGHIHKPQLVFKNTLNVGATHHQRVSDTGCDMGIWKIFDDLSFKFVKLKIPQFKYYEEGTEPGDDFNIWLQLPKDNLEDVTNDSNLSFKSKLKPETLVKNYLKIRDIKSKAKKEILLKYLSK